MSHVQFCHHCQTAAFQRLHHQSPAQEEAYQEDMADVVILDSVVVEEEDAMTTGDRSMTEDPVEVFHQENGGEAKHHRSASLVMEEEEAEAVLVLVLAGQMAIGMDEVGAVGDPGENSTPEHRGHQYYQSVLVLL
jgi:hypothetical protein